MKYLFTPFLYQVLIVGFVASQRCDFDVVNASHITLEQFRKTYLFGTGKGSRSHSRSSNSGQPVLIKGAAINWPAMTRWTREYLNKELKSALASLKIDRDDQHPMLYLFSELDKHSGKIKDSSVPLQKFQPFAKDVLPMKWFSDWRDPRKQHLLHQFFMIGGHLSGLAFHAHQEAWNGLVLGTKRWFVFPPEIDAYHFDSENGNPSWWTELSHLGRTDFVNNILAKLNPKPMECWQKAGDVIFVPHMHQHCVFNEGDLVVAVSEIHDTRSMQMFGANSGSGETVGDDNHEEDPLLLEMEI
jgi:hypothetical protein|tara:strand:- start:116 stop:1015 length:900 start_codon:yes stop_codon:yes gene_type:complete